MDSTTRCTCCGSNPDILPRANIAFALAGSPVIGGHSPHSLCVRPVSGNAGLCRYRCTVPTWAPRNQLSQLFGKSISHGTLPGKLTSENKTRHLWSPAKLCTSASLSGENGEDESNASSAQEHSLQGKQKVFFFLGNAGTGKGTQCALLAERFNLDHISAGDLLRAEVASGSEQGARVAEIMKEGRIVPSHITMGLLRNAIQRTTKAGVLIDGFPRKMDQALEFERTVSRFEFAVYLTCPEDVLITRLQKRSKFSGRADDNEESIRKRFQTFADTCFPVIEMYAERGLLREFDGSKSREEVFGKLCEAFETAVGDPTGTDAGGIQPSAQAQAT